MKKNNSIQKICFFLLLFTVLDVNSQKETILKTSFVSNSPLLSKKKDLELQDRFGNKYTSADLTINQVSTSPPSGGLSVPYVTTNTCPAGMFLLHFVDEPKAGYGFDITSNRNVICEVFKDLSRLLHNTSGLSTPIVNIVIASDTSVTTGFSGLTIPVGVDIVGTSFYPIKYNLKNAWVDNMVYTTIKSGTDAYKNLIGIDRLPNTTFYSRYHAMLIVNFNNKSWYTNFNDTASIPSNVDDLYTHTLHQALHILGLNSNLTQSGSSVLGNSLYSRFDNFLFLTNASNKLVTYNPITRKIVNTTSFTTGCSASAPIIFKGLSTNPGITIYNDTPFKKDINFSHFGCTGTGLCNSTYAKPTNQYNLVPCLGSGMTYIKRHPHQNEVYALCDLGYKLRNISGVYAFGNTISNNDSLGNVYKTYTSCAESCVAIGGHDTIIMDSLKPCTRSFSSKILNNDVPMSSIIKRMDLLDTTDGVLTYTNSSFTFTPKPSFKYGDITIAYYPQCDSSAQLGSVTYITIKYPYPPLPPCIPDGSCNLICYGDFEQSDDPILWHKFYIYDPYRDENTFDLYKSNFVTTCTRNIVDNYWGLCNYEGGGCDDFDTYEVYPHINGGNQFVGIYALDEKVPYSEGFHFKLKKPMYHDPTKRFKMRFLAKNQSNCSNNFKMLVLADDSIPRPIPDPIRPTIGGVITCAQFCDTIGSAIITSDTWQYYTIPITQPKAGDSFTDIIILSNVSTIVFESPKVEYYAFFDNFELYDSMETKAVITSNPHSLIPCNDTTQTIEYYVCLNNSSGLNSDSIRVFVTLPNGFSIAAGSDFNSSGYYTIPKNTISNTFCDTLILKYNINYNKVQDNTGYTITAGYSCNAYCVEEISDWVKIYPRNNSVTISKTVNNANPSIGNVVIFNYTVCNTSKFQISDLVFLDTFPVGLIPDNINNLTLNGQILSQNITLDSAHNGVATCQTFICAAYVMSDCKITNTAYLSSISNPCYKAKDSVVLNSAKSGTAIDGYISPKASIWCGSALPLKMNIVNPSGTYAYQWQLNGANITGGTSAIYNATVKGLYNVDISHNGCINRFNLNPFDSVFNVTKSIVRPNCTANNGSITLTPINGIKPYTYAWSGSTNTSNTRTGLAGGTYIVTITDSVGCSKIDTINLISKIDTILINKLISKSICTANNGSITLNPIKGNAPFTYLWNNGSTLQNRIGLVAGSYKVTITDSLGCQLIDSMIVDSSQNTIFANDSIIDNYCTSTSKGKIYLNPSGGMKPYQYLWDNGSTNSSRLNLSIGSYFVTITDSFGCNLKDTILLTNKTSTLKFNDSIVAAYCINNTGKAFLRPRGGTEPYSFLWSNGSKKQDTLGLLASTYYTTVTDANGCIGIDTLYVNFYLSSKLIQDSIINPYCSSLNGEIHLKVSGSNPPFQFLWSNGVADSIILNIDSGNYTVIVTDSFGCIDTNTYTVSTITNTVNVLDSINHIYCFNLGSIYLKPNPSQSYFYIWDNGDTTLYRDNLSTGNYSVSIFDNLGCFNSYTKTILDIGNNLVINDSIISPTNCVLLNGNIYSNVTGGQKPYSYLWSTGETSANLLGISSGNFILTVTDASGCTAVKSFIINPPINVRGYIRELINCTTNTATLEFINLTNAPISNYYWKNLTNNFVLSNTNTAYVPNNSHNIKLFVTEPNGCETIYFSTPNAVNYTTLGSNYGASKASLDQAIANGYTSDVDSIRKFKIGGTFTIDDNWDLKHTDIILEPGAIIKIGLYNTPIVNLSNNNIYTCLGQLAKGFEINRDNTEFNFTNNIIRDCYKAIEVSFSIKAEISNNKFQNNLIGIHFVGTLNNMLNITNTDNFIGNKFLGNELGIFNYKTVKPSYTTMVQDFRSFSHFNYPTRSGYSEPWTGMLFEYVTNLTVGKINENRIEMTRMNNGLLHYGGNLTLNNFYIDDMPYNNNSVFMSGTGIYSAENPKLYTNLTINGVGKNAPEIINNVEAGIYIYGNMTTKLLNTSMGSLKQGVILNEKNNSVFSTNFTASNNRIGANVIALNINNYKNNFICTITNNQLTIGSVNVGSLANYLPTAIELSNNNMSINNAIVKIDNNTIGTNQSKAESGIDIQGFPKTIAKNSIKVTNNNINFNSLSYLRAGISYFNNYNIYEENNTIIGNNRATFNPNLSPRIYPIGINYEASEGTFKCNTINNLRTGARFMGPCLNSDWQKNKLNNHTYGLRLETGTTLQSHDRKGNSFAGTCDTEAISWQLIPTIFKYRNTNPIYLPNIRWSSNPSWWIYFPSNIENNSCGNIITLPNQISGTIKLGFYNETIAYKDNGNFTPMSREYNPIEPLELTVVDTSILMNHILFNLYEPELVWQQRLLLYDKLKPFEPEYPDTSIYRDFITQIEDGTINEFSQITKLESAIVEEHQDIDLTIQSVLSTIDSAWLDIHRLDSSYHETRDTAVLEGIVAERLATYQYILSQNAVLTGLYTTQVYADSVQVEAIELINDSIAPEGRADSLRWEFNKVYYATYGRGLPEMNNAQYAIYHSLAQHCPYENFDVVYRSRAITGIRNDSIRYNDSILCSQVGITLKATKPIVYNKKIPEPKITYNVFPNPTKEFVNIVISKIPSSKLQFIVTNILGIEVFNSIMKLNSNNFTIDTKLWNEGIYHLRIKEDNLLLYFSQIHKIK